MRLSRRPWSLSSGRAPRRPVGGLCRMRNSVNVINGFPYPEERPEGASRRTHYRDAALGPKFVRRSGVTADPGTAAVIRAGETDAGQRLDRVLAAHLPELSRTRLKRLIGDGYVTQDGVIVRDPSLRARC